MTRYPRWKFYLLLGVLSFCGLYALPNLYPDVPAIQVTSAEAGGDVSGNTQARILKSLDDAGIGHGAGEIIGTSWLVRVDTNEEQLRAKEIAEKLLGQRFVVALNLAPTTPDWLRSIGASPMNLGLDLRGGVHFLIQVDVDAAIQSRLVAWAGEVKLLLKEEGARYRDVEVFERERADGEIERGLHITMANSGGVDEVATLISQSLREFAPRVDDSEGNAFAMILTSQAIKTVQDYAVNQNRTSLNNRVNELGVGEPVVQRQGADRIVVQLPGIQDAAQARRILGRTATLEFRLVAHEYGANRAATGIAPPGTEIYPFKGSGRPVILRKQAIVSGDEVTNAQMGFDAESNTPQVSIALDGIGGQHMQRITGKNIGNPMAVLFSETKTDIERYTDEEGVSQIRSTQRTERNVISVATIQGAFGSRFNITGLDSPAEAGELALLLRSGSLAAPMFIIEERTIGPSLGADNIKAGFNSMMIGMALVLAFMAIWYKAFGLVANVALLGNLVIIIGVMSLIPGATLTLPGIAGIVLTVGMAVDANVLIFEQIKQSLKNGLNPLQAIDAGFERAFSTIVDANITTLIAAVILFAAGSGSVQGFAVTLFIGILTSMFTAIVGTRSIVELIYGRAGRVPSKLRI